MRLDGVSVAFEMIMEEIKAVEEQLNYEGAAAFKDSRYDDASRLIASCNKLAEFRGKLEALGKEWNAGIDAHARERVKVDGYHIAPHSKGPKTNLRIILEGGKVI